VVAEGLGCSASDVVGAVWRNSWEFPRAHAPVALCDEASLGTRVFREAGLPPGRAVHARRALSTESSLHVLVWRDPRVAAPERELSVLDLATEALARIAQPFIAEHASWFTPRETEVLDLLVQGRTVAEIARHIHRSPHTVQDHIKSMHNKANVSTRGGLVAAACGVESVEPVSPRRGDN
jgi:DNA-binding CsgD family transcriptional regulator